MELRCFHGQIHRAGNMRERVIERIFIGEVLEGGQSISQAWLAVPEHRSGLLPVLLALEEGQHSVLVRVLSAFRA